MCHHALQPDVVLSQLVQGVSLLQLELLDLLHSSLVLRLQQSIAC